MSAHQVAFAFDAGEDTTADGDPQIQTPQDIQREKESMIALSWAIGSYGMYSPYIW